MEDWLKGVLISMPKIINDVNNFYSDIKETKYSDLSDEQKKQLDDLIHKTERATRSFTMTEKEYESAKIFASKHTKCYTSSALGERFAYTFIPGGLGNIVKIKCIICGAEENITDVDCW